MPRSVIAGSHGKGVFRFVRKHSLASRSGCAVLHSHQPRVSERSCCSVSLSALGVVGVSGFGRSHGCVVVSHVRCSNSQSLTTTDVKHLFSRWFVPCGSSLVRCPEGLWPILSSPLPVCQVGYFVFLLLHCQSPLVFQLQAPNQT